ncbi:MAG: T9SS type A sorting domain-containing protein [Chitinophagaceae bacterium]|nr:T9SS type A sorting domain-containing protein [Chitinophagaceae bacterium]
MIKKSLLLTLLLTALFFSHTVKAQTAQQINGPDCNGVTHDLFSELDAGKAVIVYFFMPNCNYCPPPADKIQTMANNIMQNYPGKITAYARPYNNVTTCQATASWVSTNNLNFYAPYDSGAVQVAYYGGFGMPTVVLLGGADHRVMFFTKTFMESDTLIMRDSILALFTAAPAGLETELLPEGLNSLEVYPNPVKDLCTVHLDLAEDAQVRIELLDHSGRQIALITDKQNKQGALSYTYDAERLAAGNYSFRIRINDKNISRKVAITH